MEQIRKLKMNNNLVIVLQKNNKTGTSQERLYESKEWMNINKFIIEKGIEGRVI